ncbi:MAG: hypothetical protein JWM11_3205 [Planctomycetaceae bacterium]|nr:hypothetical protein [Planctomycetaceae bacterium]
MLIPAIKRLNLNRLNRTRYNTRSRPILSAIRQIGHLLSDWADAILAKVNGTVIGNELVRDR